jgi:hypothetical protein
MTKPQYFMTRTSILTLTETAPVDEWGEKPLDPLADPFDDPCCTCDACGAQVETIIGTPKGTEICQQCFDAGVD